LEIKIQTRATKTNSSNKPVTAEW